MRDTEIFSLRGEAHHPWHLYAGVVLLNEEGRVPIVRDSEGVYELPKDTLTSNENLIVAVHRIILEQIRVVPYITEYLGSRVTEYKRYDGSGIEKTVLYFDARCTSPMGGLPSSREGMVWVTLDEAYEILHKERSGEETIIDHVRAGRAVPHL